MKDVAIALEHRPGALADLGETLGRAGVSVEGGGAFRVDGRGLAHFLFDEGAAARAALEAAGMNVLAENEVVVLELDQDRPGQLGAVCRRMAAAEVDIEVLYSDHANQLILVVDDLERGRIVAQQWRQDAERRPSR